jgi:hypothetical protein
VKFLSTLIITLSGSLHINLLSLYSNNHLLKFLLGKRFVEIKSRYNDMT